MTPEQKRERLVQLIADDDILLLPGAFNAAAAKLAQQTGFEAVYVSGSATAGAVFGLPDLGLGDLVTAGAEAERIASAVDIPTIADADTGFGDVAEAVSLFEAAGLVLLIAMIGAIVLTLRSREGVKKQRIASQLDRRREQTVELKKVQPGSGVS